MNRDKNTSERLPAEHYMEMVIDRALALMMEVEFPEGVTLMLRVERYPPADDLQRGRLFHGKFVTLENEKYGTIERFSKVQPENRVREYTKIYGREADRSLAYLRSLQSGDADNARLPQCTHGADLSSGANYSRDLSMDARIIP